MILVNALLFQCLWFAAVLGAARGLWWPALPALAVLIAWCLRYSTWTRLDLRLMWVSAILGLVAESAFALTGVIDYATALPSESLAPFWILLMWCGFGLTINHSLWPLVRRPWTAALSGAVFGPLAYFGAARLGAVDGFGLATLETGLLIAAAWAACLTLLSVLASQWRRPEPAP